MTGRWHICRDGIKCLKRLFLIQLFQIEDKSTCVFIIFVANRQFLEFIFLVEWNGIDISIYRNETAAGLIFPFKEIFNEV